MKISEIMKKSFLFFDSDDTIASAAKRLVEKGQSEAPVVREGKFIGMFLTSDLCAALVKTSIFGKPKAEDAVKVQNQIVGKHIGSRRTYLAPEADILSAFLLLVHRNVDIIPVIDKERKILGIVKAEDVRKEILKMLSSGGKIPVRTPEKLQQMDALGGKTAIDLIVHYVEEKGVASAKEVAKHCNLTVDEVEEYAASLEKNRLLKLEYDILGKMKLRRPDVG
ncbi:MAG: CBS domain-containing protein [Candidatus Anstonellaceae archaeon]